MAIAVCPSGEPTRRRANHPLTATCLPAACQVPLAKIFCFSEYSEYPIFPLVPPHQKGRIMIVAKRGAGCGGRWRRQRRGRFSADGKTVWSCHPDAGVKSALRRAGDGGQQARSTGESAE